MNSSKTSKDRLRVCAVSYLNTAPLVWGMLHGAQRGLFDISFAIPSECADRLARGEADIGIVPAAELLRQNLEVLPGSGIASRGPVRSILLVSKVPRPAIRVLAADTSSRTSVVLARILLDRRYGARPELVPHPPDLPAMLGRADAALIMGDPALRVELEQPGCEVYDLGEEWTAWTGLPMVFAVWAGRPGCIAPEVTAAFTASCRFGLERVEEIAEREGPARGMSVALAREYLTRNVVNLFGDGEYEGLRLFLDYAREWTGPPPGERR